MNDKSYNKRQVRALLAVVVLLAAYFGFTGALQLLQQHRLDAASRREAVQHAAVPSRASQQHWSRAWTCPAGAALSGAPAPWSRGWIAATGKGRLVALDNRGQVLWDHACSNAPVAGSPVVAGAHVVVAGCDGAVTALDAGTGKPVWQVNAGGSYRHGPLAVQQGPAWQVVLLSSGDGVMSGFDANDGRLLWRSEPTSRSDGAPGSDGTIIAYGNCDSAVHVFRAASGARLAQIPVGAEAQMAGGTLVRDGRVYGGTRRGTLVCVDVASNAVAWQAEIESGEAFGTPVAARDRVIMGANDGRIAAFAARDGAPQWRVSLGHAVKSLCVVDDAVFAVAGGSLVGLRIADGGTFLNLAVGDDVAGPVWNGQVLAVADDGGNVIGFKGD
jgi:outer membrane protein assembly factor BamB